MPNNSTGDQLPGQPKQAQSRKSLQSTHVPVMGKVGKENRFGTLWTVVRSDRGRALKVWCARGDNTLAILLLLLLFTKSMWLTGQRGAHHRLL